MRRLFTLDEARTQLPEIRRILAALQEARRQAALYAETSLRLRARLNGNIPPISEAAPEIPQEFVTTMRRQIERLREIGCELKDIDEGLVDFPAERDGRVVYLCWRLGEDDIGFWHELDSGFASRRPL